MGVKYIQTLYEKVVPFEVLGLKFWFRFFWSDGWLI
jgi:hypothetical protein